MDELGKQIIDAVRQRLVRELPPQIHKSLEEMSDAQIWWRPNAGSNSVGNLVLHLCGSMRHFLGRGVGGTDYRRDRPAEFAEKGPIPRQELRRVLDDSVTEADRILSDLAPGRLLDVTERAGDSFTVLAILLRMSHHWAAHTSQIVYIAKAFREGPVAEIARRPQP